MLKLMTVLAALALPAMADLATVDAFVNPSSSSDPACSQANSGASSASASFSCMVDGYSFAGGGSAATGIGPYGIGFDIVLYANGLAFSQTLQADTTVSASVSSSQEFTVEGAVGSGFMDVTLSARALGTLLGGTSFEFDILG